MAKTNEKNLSTNDNVATTPTTDENVEQSPVSANGAKQDEKHYTKYNRPSSDNMKTVDEIDGWVTTVKAAEIIGIRTSSVNYLVYGGQVEGVRISGAILVRKESAEAYKLLAAERDRVAAEKREAKEQERKAVEFQKKVLDSLKSLPPDQLQIALNQLGIELPQ